MTVCIYLFKHIFNLIENGDGKGAHSTLMGVWNWHIISWKFINYWEFWVVFQ